MMGDRNYTIIIVPKSTRQVTKLHISARLFSYGVIAVALLVLTGIGTMIHYVKLYAQSKKIATENTQLRSSLQQSRVLTEKLNKKISGLARLSAQLKAAAGMPKIASRRLPPPRMGVGGVRMDLTDDPAELMALQRRAEALEKNLVSLRSYFEEYRPFTTPSILPTTGIVSSSFGGRRNPFSGLADFHEGLDISNSIGTPVHAAADGTIVYAGYKGTLGMVVEIQHDQEITTRYGHLGLMFVKTGNQIKRGQRIGLMGSSGMSTGPHLHYEIRVNDQAVNPRSYISTQTASR